MTMLHRILRMSEWRRLEDGRVWTGIYAMRTVILVTLGIGSLLSDTPRVAAVIIFVVVPYNLLVEGFHRKRGRPHALLPMDQILAAVCTLIAPQAAFGTIICSLAAAGTDTLGIKLRRVQLFTAGGSAILLIAAFVHHDQVLAAFVVPQLIATFALTNVVSYLKNKRSAAADRFEGLLDGLHAYVCEVDLDSGNITYCNQQMLQRFGSATQLSDLLRHIHPDDVESVTRAYERGAKSMSPVLLDVRLVLGDDVLFMEQRTTFAKYKGRVRVRSVLFDVSSRKRVELEMQHRAFHDTLTELPNRALFLDRLEHALIRSERGQSQHAVMLCDLDNFKDVNDSMGHHVGDALLVEVSSRLSRVVGKVNTLARLGGDEFAILLEDTDPAEALVIGRKLNAIVSTAYVNGEMTVFPRISIGVATYPRHGLRSSELLQHADVAMYHAKRLRLGVVEFEDDMNPASAQKLAVLADFRSAIANNELEAFFQPVVDSMTRKVTSCEALVRWNHPKLGLLAPASFVPIVCAGGLSRELAQWMLTEVVNQIAIWSQDDLAIPVSVNMSAIDVADERLIEWLLDELGRRSIRPSLLTIELTEAELLDQSAKTIQTLERLRNAGVTTAVDDFGTGYSSLVWLRDLPIRSLKIDRSFVDSMFSDERSETIVRSTIEMAKALKLNIIGEGVEDVATATALQNLGCHNLQGYLFGRPVGADAMRAILLNGIQAEVPQVSKA
jgi:diguanylate cyclase (GGDEF)-like protein